MKKRVIRIFYSWQDDIESKLNRFFIKDCLESALLKVNKDITLEESERISIELDHDTKNVPGLPDIASTILQKISSSDIFIADLSFVSSYLNHKKRTKKVSNQNVIFELGFAFNVIGPQKIICFFNEGFGSPAELLFDLKHRRWPIIYNLTESNLPDRGKIKEEVSKELANSINLILEKVPLRKNTPNIHIPFTVKQINEFEYIDSKLNIGIFVSLSYQENPDYDVDRGFIEKPKTFKEFYFPLKNLFLNQIKWESNYFDTDEARRAIWRTLQMGRQFPSGSTYHVEIDYDSNEIITPLIMHDLISTNKKFQKKAYKYLKWLEYNGHDNFSVIYQPSTETIF